MPGYTTENIRNIALLGHSGSGKTTLAEALLHRFGAIDAPGNVSKGTTVSDSSPQEKTLGHSIDSAVASFDSGGFHINIIDTPGFLDFLGRTKSVLPAVETIAVVVNAQVGIEPMTRRVMNYAAERRLCRMIIVNQIDAPGVDLAGLMVHLRDSFGAECLPINLPAPGHGSVVDCFFNPDGDSAFSSVAEAHTAIIDQVVEVDEDLMALYLEQGQDLSPDQLHEPFEKALREGHLVPVAFVSATTGAGLDALQQLFVELMPNPLEGNPRPFVKGWDEAAAPFTTVPDPDRHVVAHVFKVTMDPFMGKVATFRIHQGTITPNSQMFIGDGRKPFKAGHLYRPFGKELREMERGIPGDICAVTKVDDIHFDAVLHDSHDEDLIHLKPLDFPEPMYGLAIEPTRRGDEQKLSDALHKLSEEDPCFRVEHNSVTNETVIRGLGELHLRIALERMRDRFNVEVDTRTPRIAYRETITAASEGHYRHKKQTGGAGQFGEVFLRVRPLERGEGFRFVNAVVGGAIPTNLIPAVEKGIRQALETGIIAGYALHDLEVTVYDGKYHPVDSKEVAFVTAGKKAFQEAVKQARPVVLEPMVNIHITTPDSAIGAIAGGLSSKRGRVNSTDTISDGQAVIHGMAPLAELGDYQTELKSVTGGQGSYTMELSHYDPVPFDIQQRLMAEFHPQED